MRDTEQSGRGLSPRLRLQLVLLLVIIWDAIALLAELTFGGALFDISGDKIGGLLAARGSFGGATIVPLTLYIYAFVRGPMRYRGLIWVSVLEQAMVALFAVYHLAVEHIKPEGVIAPLVVSLGLVVLILVNLPRERTTTTPLATE